MDTSCFLLDGISKVENIGVGNNIKKLVWKNVKCFDFLRSAVPSFNNEEYRQI